MDSPKTPFWTTISPHDAFAAPLSHADFLGYFPTFLDFFSPSSYDSLLLGLSNNLPVTSVAQ